jgi:hypothetical protein
MDESVPEFVRSCIATQVTKEEREREKDGTVSVLPPLGFEWN